MPILMNNMQTNIANIIEGITKNEQVQPYSLQKILDILEEDDLIPANYTEILNNESDGSLLKFEIAFLNRKFFLASDTLTDIIASNKKFPVTISSTLAKVILDSMVITGMGYTNLPPVEKLDAILNIVEKAPQPIKDMTYTILMSQQEARSVMSRALTDDALYDDTPYNAQQFNRFAKHLLENSKAHEPIIRFFGDMYNAALAVASIDVFNALSNYLHAKDDPVLATIADIVFRRESYKLDLLSLDNNIENFKIFSEQTIQGLKEDNVQKKYIDEAKRNHDEFLINMVEIIGRVKKDLAPYQKEAIQPDTMIEALQISESHHIHSALTPGIGFSFN